MTTVIALAWFFSSAAAIFFIFRPRSDWPLVANRKRALGVFAAVFLGGPVLTALISPTGRSAPDTTPEKPKTPEQIAAEAKSAEEKREADALRDMNDNPENYLSFGRVRGSKGGFDTVFILSGTLKNGGKVAYKDPVIQCDVFSETDTALGRVRDTLYKAVPAGETVDFSEFNMGFASSDWQKFSCSVKSAAVVGAADD